MFGKLSWEAIPTSEPIVMYTLAFVGLIGVALVGSITWKRKWGYLWREWFTSVDHKKIGCMYIIVALVMLLRGFSDAIMMRTQQAMAASGGPGYLPPEHYDQIFTAHGVIAIFFMAMPFVVGLMNIVVPLQIGARDVAYPFLNALSFWLFVVGAALVNISLGVGEFARTGWSCLSAVVRAGLQPRRRRGLLHLVTADIRHRHVTHGGEFLRDHPEDAHRRHDPVQDARVHLERTVHLGADPGVVPDPDRHPADAVPGPLPGHAFFTNEAGGNPMMYVNLIWARGHPEVYILILPAFGVFSEIVATFSSKRLFGYVSLVWATIAITVLSFIVWLHHFFTMGSGGNVNAFFGIMTMIIAVPTGVKIFTWLFTMYRGRVRFETPMLWTLGFIVTFSIGGMTGVLLAVPGADFMLHNSLFLIAHFHNVIIGGAVFGYMAGLTYWFPKAFGFRLYDKLGRIRILVLAHRLLFRLHALVRAGLHGHDAPPQPLQQPGMAALAAARTGGRGDYPLRRRLPGPATVCQHPLPSPLSRPHR
ncbi:cbb3-type cytochrome c oxidase subunit I [Pseudomonas sp. H2_E05]